MFGLDIHKQLYPQKYYTEQRIYSNDFIGDINEAAQVKNWNEKQMRTFYCNVVIANALLRDPVRKPSTEKK